MDKLWPKNLFADLGAEKKLEFLLKDSSKVRLSVEAAKTDGTRNPIHAVSYASVSAGKRKRRR
jgi:hypothetical protein